MTLAITSRLAMGFSPAHHLHPFIARNGDFFSPFKATNMMTQRIVLTYLYFLLFLLITPSLADEHNPSEAAPLARDLASIAKIGELATIMAPGVHEGVGGMHGNCRGIDC